MLSVGLKKYIDTQLYCPLSGLKLNGQAPIPPHKMGVMQCANGSLFSKCSIHLVRCFISDFDTVRNIMEKATVVRVIEDRKKEKKNAAS